jgi:hypothetical protein
MADIRAAITKLLMGKPGGPWEGGIRAYHSSPHDFDRFDWSKLRTGEGANSYGAGFYAAENPAVSGQGGQYWKQFYNRFPVEEMDTAELLRQHGFQRDPAIATVQGHIDALKKSVSEVEKRGGANLEFYQRMLAARERERDVLASGGPVGPRTYEVNITARPELMLDWDKPMSQQSKVVRDILSSGSPEQWGHDPTGREMYQRISRQMHDRYGQTDRGVQANYASQELADAGIPGIRYLDQGSRGYSDIAPFIAQHGGNEKALEYARGRHAETLKQYGEGSIDARDWAKTIKEIETPPTYNYVVTDPSKLDILAKYGVVGGAAVPVMSGAFDQSQYGAQQ